MLRAAFFLKLAIISTGGTISSAVSGNSIKPTGPYDFHFDKLLTDIAEGYSMSEDIDVYSPVSLLSENIEPSDWITIAHSIKDKVDQGADGVIVLHGTDTMAYSLAAVSFLLDPIPVPIIFTGSNLPFNQAGSETFRNIKDSILYAIKKAQPGVYLIFESEFSKNNEKTSYDADRVVLWGPRVRSIGTFEYVYKSIDEKNVGVIKNGKIVDNGVPIQNPISFSEEIEIHNKLDDRVSMFRVYPGWDPKVMNIEKEKGTRAIILDLYHSGTGDVKNPKYSLLPTVKELTEAGILIFGSGIDLNSDTLYESTSELLEAGLKPLGQITIESAYVKLMYCLGAEDSKESILQLFYKSIYGERVDYSSVFERRKAFG
jgi:glutamyl-tRNA(Gln) amidotransferase subunit D